MYGYIYETTNLINGKKYIGQKKSKYFDESYKGSGIYIKNAINKYGKENFSVRLIEECDSKENLDSREFYWIDYYNAVNSDNYYNLAKGGIGTVSGSKHSQEWKQKMSKTMSNKHHSQETKNKIRDIVTGKIWIANDTLGKTKQVYPEQAIKYLEEGWRLGRMKPSQETLRKSSISRKGKSYMTEEQKKSLSEKRSGVNNPFYGKHHSIEQKEKWKNIRHNKVWVNDGIKNTTINKEDLPSYLNEGWVRGMIKHNKVGSETIESVDSEKDTIE